MTRVRAAARVSSAYPLLLVSGGALGLIEPRLGDGSGRPGGAAVVGLLPAFLLSLGCVLAQADRAAADPRGRVRRVGGLALFALLSWLGLFALASLLIPFRTC